MQGVFYRASTQEEAKRLRLTGYVKNLSSGDVMIEAEGDISVLENLVAWCRQGPPLSKVTDVEVLEGAVVHFAEFEIRR